MTIIHSWFARFVLTLAFHATEIHKNTTQHTDSSPDQKLKAKIPSNLIISSTDTHAENHKYIRCFFNTCPQIRASSKRTPDPHWNLTRIHISYTTRTNEWIATRHIEWKHMKVLPTPRRSWSTSTHTHSLQTVCSRAKAAYSIRISAPGAARRNVDDDRDETRLGMSVRYKFQHSFLALTPECVYRRLRTCVVYVRPSSICAV